ncbi:MAG TPA: hypothetical protein VGR19_04625 [Allosphingosinicella sp.]|nr:hypothetical protein [Allosphingosinicella sp.]
MTDKGLEAAPLDVAQVRDHGRREGFAIAALALGLVSFVNLFGAEKSILAIVLATMAMSRSSTKTVRRRAFIAMGLALLHIVTLAVVLVLFQEELGQFIKSLHKLS